LQIDHSHVEVFSFVVTDPDLAERYLKMGSPPKWILKDGSTTDSLHSNDRFGAAHLAHPSITDQLSIEVSLARFPSSVSRRAEVRRQLRLPVRQYER
jgi:hypothetical protein